jgi:hypothetical protein
MVRRVTPHVDHTRCAAWARNPKSEARNPKQIQNPKGGNDQNACHLLCCDPRCDTGVSPVCDAVTFDIPRFSGIFFIHTSRTGETPVSRWSTATERLPPGFDHFLDLDFVLVSDFEFRISSFPQDIATVTVLTSV